MARVTVEDCVQKVPNRFQLVLLASQRARNLSRGEELTIDRDNDKNPVVALREIADETIELPRIEQDLIKSLSRAPEPEPADEEVLDLIPTDQNIFGLQDVTAEEVNRAFATAAFDPKSSLGRVLRYSTDPIVSRDIIGDSASCVFDSPLTQASGRLVKVFGWYDNEWGYTCRLADLAALVGRQL